MVKISVTFHNINLSLIEYKPKLTDTQLILLYLKFISNIINFETFSSQYKITYDSFKKILKILEKQQIVKEINKGNSRFTTYKLLKPNIQVFPHASNSEEKLIFKYFNLRQQLSEEEINYIQIILNANALKILKNIRKKFKLKPFKKSSIIDTDNKSKSFKFLIDYKALKKFPIPHTYVLTQYYDHAILNAKLKKNPPIIYETDPDSILQDAKFQKLINVHNLSIEAQLEGLCDDLKGHYREYEPFIDKSIQNTKVKAFTYYEKNKIIITIGCSESPIYSNQILRFNKILARIIDLINSNPYVTRKYDYDYHRFTIVKKDLALDGKVYYRLKKGLQFQYNNTDDQELFLYVKKNYKSSNSSWIRCERRAVNSKDSIDEFRNMLMSNKLNISPSCI